MDAVASGVVAPVVDERWAVSIDEAAKRLGIGRTLMHEAAKRGDYPTIRIGKRRVIPMTVINEWMERGYNPQKED